VLVFWLRQPGRVVFTVLSATPSCRVLGSFAYRGRSGVNRVRYRGRLDGKPLPPGRYTLVPRVYRGGSVTQLERVTIQILRPRAKVALWRRTALVPGECRGDRLAGIYEPTQLGGRFAGSTAASYGSGAASGGAASAAAERSGGVKSAEATVPPADAAAEPVDDDPDSDGSIALPFPLPGDEGDGPPPLLAAAVLTGLGLAIMMLVVLLVRYVRGSWNP
jgi:hypothetical protein